MENPDHNCPKAPKKKQAPKKKVEEIDPALELSREDSLALFEQLDAMSRELDRLAKSGALEKGDFEVQFKMDGFDVTFMEGVIDDKDSANRLAGQNAETTEFPLRVRKLTLWPWNGANDSVAYEITWTKMDDYKGLFHPYSIDVKLIGLGADHAFNEVLDAHVQLRTSGKSAAEYTDGLPQSLGGVVKTVVEKYAPRVAKSAKEQATQKASKFLRSNTSLGL